MDDRRADVNQVAEDRLVRIETKLDKLSEAVIAIARTEERMTTIFSKHDALEVRVDQQAIEIDKLREKAHAMSNKLAISDGVATEVRDMEELLDKLKIDTHDNSIITARVEKVSWVIFTTLLGVIGFLTKEFLVR